MVRKLGVSVVMPTASAAPRPLLPSSLLLFLLGSCGPHLPLATPPLHLPPSAALRSGTPLCSPHIRRGVRHHNTLTAGRASPITPSLARGRTSVDGTEEDPLTFSLCLLPSVFVCSRAVSLPSFFLLLLLWLLLSQTCCCRARRPLPLNAPLPSTSLMLFLASAARHYSRFWF